jgi:iron complex outermembrane receptor protein
MAFGGANSARSGGNMRIRGSVKAILVATAAVPAILWQTFALADDTGGLETVVVTAERRAEPIYDVPATITAISGEQLQNLGFTDMKSIIQMVPNTVLADDPENFETYINIRGIRQADINAEPNFGLYRNGFFAGGERANLGAYIDIDRVEVLSGPQSGLYGRDAVGGVVNVIYKTASTSDGFGGYAIADYGRYDRSELQGAVNIPITDNFAVRATGWWINQNEGQLYNNFLNQYIDRNRDFGGRVSAKWDVSNRLSVVWLSDLEDKHGPSFTAYAPDGIGGLFNVNCCGLPYQPPETLSTISEDTPDVEHWQQFFISQDANYDTKSWVGSFELLTSYRNYHMSEEDDWDHTAFSPTTNPGMIQQIQYRNEGLHQFYGELLWKSPENQRFTWLGGVDYYNEVYTFDRIFTGSVDFNLLNNLVSPGFSYGNLLCSFLMAGNNPPGSYDGGCEGTPPTSPGLPGAGPNGQFPYNFPNAGVQSGANAFGAPGSGISTTSESAFVSANYKLTDDLNLTGEVRWDQTRKSLFYIQGPVSGFGATALGTEYLGPLFAQVFDPYTSSQADTFVNVAPSATLQYKVSDNANVYATYATGFRSGGFNLGTSSPAHLAYKAEKDANYEVGAKTLWLDGTLSLNADVFYMTQSSLVEDQTDTSEPAFLNLYYLANVGGAHTPGAEFQALYQATKWMNVGASVGWLDARYTQGDANGTSVAGQQIELTRHWTINLTDDVNFPLTSDMEFVGNANYRLELGGFLPPALPPTYALETTPYKTMNKLDLDAGVAVGNTRVVAYVDNAFDCVIWQFQYTAGVVNVNQGRTFGIRLEQKF